MKHALRSATPLDDGGSFGGAVRRRLRRSHVVVKPIVAMHHELTWAQLPLDDQLVASAVSRELRVRTISTPRDDVGNDPINRRLAVPVAVPDRNYDAVRFHRVNPDAAGGAALLRRNEPQDGL
jgi:hypothetical protein